MVEIYSVCGKWEFNENSQWEFLVDTNKGGSLSEVDDSITYIGLVEMAIEDFGLGCLVKDTDITLSYELPPRMKSMIEDSQPVYMRNDRQVRTFISKIKGNGELIRLCVTVNDKCNMIVVENVGNNIQSKTIHNEVNADAEKTGCIAMLENVDESNVHEEQEEATRSDMLVHVTHNDTCSTTESENHPLLVQSAPYSSPVSLGCSESAGVTNDLHVNKYFKDKQDLMLTMRKLALEWKFQFKSRWSNKSRVVLGCVDDKCCWRMRATKLLSSDFFVVKDYVHEHTCDPTHRPSHRQANVKLLGSLICSKYGENKYGLKPKQIIEEVRKEHDLQITYKLAWRVKEHAQNLMRGVPDSVVSETLSAPPTTGESSDRPSKKRMRSVRDSGASNSESRKYKCSRCGKDGHNKNTCKAPK